MEGREYLQIYAGVQYHLFYNFYPPIKESFVKPAFYAVIACRNGEYNKMIETPAGSHEAIRIVDSFRLEFYLDAEVEDAGY